MTIYFNRVFVKKLHKLQKKDKRIAEELKEKLSVFSNDPLLPSLRLHKLQGKLATLWSISLSDSYRVIFAYVKNGIIFMDIGFHDEVYR